MQITKEFKTPGIYCIKNVKNNKMYIGSSKDIYQRLSKHKSELSHNRHQNYLLQNAFNKYGLDGFECKVFEIVLNFNDLTEREQYWINTLKPIYNITQEVVRNTLTSESKIKISETLKRKYKSGEIQVTRTTPVNLYDNKGVYLKTFKTQKDCAKYLNIHHKSITNLLNNKYKQINGYQIKYYKGITADIEAVEISRFAPIDVFDMEDNYIRTFYKRTECAKEMNLSVSSIQKVAIGEMSSAKGFKFKNSFITKEEYKRAVQQRNLLDNDC